MATTTAPLLSFAASGQIAKTQVYSIWKGRPYVRRYTIPSNPDTAEQQLTRTAFAWLNDIFKYFPGSALDAWNAYADVSRFTARNGMVKQNLSTLRTAANITGMIMSPAARSGIAASAIALTAGAGQITVDLTAPEVPTGWTVASAFAVAIPDQDPNTGTNFEVVAGSDAAAPYSIVLTGLTAAQLYVVGGWFSFTRPDGLTAYGQAINDTATPT